MRNVLLGLIAFGLMAASASAIPVDSCTTYASVKSNGSESFPGTYVGTMGSEVGQVCQIGDLALYDGGSGGANVNVSRNPSIYEVYWGGGELTITEQIGNNGIGDAIGVDLDSLASQDSTSPASVLATITIPFTSGPSSTYTLFNGDLDTGYYAIDTYLAAGNVIDPNYQINIASTSAPEPSAMFPLLAVCLAAFAWTRRFKLRTFGLPRT